MFTLPMFRPHDARPATRRPLPGRQPSVEDLEGRRLQSGLMVTTEVAGQHIGVIASEIQGAHIVSMANGGGGVGQHIGVVAD
jgi:hypothetical protein